MSFRVAISMRVVNPEAYHEPRDALSQDWHPFLAQCNLQALPVPNMVEVYEYLSGMDIAGVILSGGNNIHPESYGYSGSDTISDTAIERDQTESELIEWAIKNNKPVIGVCRGMHMLNVYMGGSIIPHLKKEISDLGNHVNCEHDLSLCDLPFTASFGGEDLIVNSFHNQGIIENNLAEAFTCAAVSKQDAIVEAFYEASRSLIGIQWHPERPNSAHDFDVSLFTAVFSPGFNLESWLKSGAQQ